jgi:hypothetical protein
VGGYSISQLAPVPERFTPVTQLGPVRWVLVALIAVGLFGALAGPIVRAIGRAFAFPRRRR